jgi:RimJ/RimL family protein N-acetyltransferase
MIETERLILRELAIGDAPELHALMTDADFLRNIGDRGIATVADAEHAISNRFIPGYKRDGFGLWAVVERATGAWLGLAGLVKRAGLDHVDLGFALMPAARGRGIAREAVGAVARWAAAQGIAPVVAIVNPDNAGSIAVLEGLGLVRKGLIRLPSADKDVLLYVPVTPAG